MNNQTSYFLYNTSLYSLRGSSHAHQSGDRIHPWSLGGGRAAERRVGRRSLWHQHTADLDHGKHARTACFFPPPRAAVKGRSWFLPQTTEWCTICMKVEFTRKEIWSTTTAVLLQTIRCFHKELLFCNKNIKIYLFIWIDWKTKRNFGRNWRSE